MKQTEKNSSKQVNNETLNVETLKSQLKAACVNMNAKETKEYIKTLDGYELRLTGQKPTQHYTIFYGEVRICNVEQVQGIKADGSSRGCVSVTKINFFEKVDAILANYKKKLCNDDELKQLDELDNNWTDVCCRIEEVLKAANKRASDKAKEAAAAKREAAAKERATKKVGKKIAAGTDSEKIAAIAAALDCDYETAKSIYEKKRAQKTA